MAPSLRIRGRIHTPFSWRTKSRAQKDGYYEQIMAIQCDQCLTLIIHQTARIEMITRRLAHIFACWRDTVSAHAAMLGT
jgi:hypothetical protein